MNPSGGSGLHIPHDLRQCMFLMESKQQVHVIVRPVDFQKVSPTFPEDAAQISIKPPTPFRGQEGEPILG